MAIFVATSLSPPNCPDSLALPHEQAAVSHRRIPEAYDIYAELLLIEAAFGPDEIIPHPR